MDELGSQGPRKRQKTEYFTSSQATWLKFEDEVTAFEVQHIHGKGKFGFQFQEGPLVKALRSGSW
jgi:midasin